MKLQRKRLHTSEDSVVWEEAKDGRFAVKWLYGELEPTREMVFLSKVI